MKKLLLAIALFGVLTLFNALWHWDSSAPTVDWQGAPTVVGENSTLALQIEDSGRGLQFIEIALSASGNRQILLSETYATTWSWQPGVHRRSMTFSPRTSFGRRTPLRRRVFLGSRPA